MKYPLIVVIFLCCVQVLYAKQPITIEISLQQGDATVAFKEAILQVKKLNGTPAILNIAPGKYYFSREASTKKVYHISNTTSEQEDADPTKHIALFLEKLQNVTIQGNGSTLLMTGEMTSFVIDDCKNIIFKNLNFDYVHPTQTEVTVDRIENGFVDFSVHPRAPYKLENGTLTWYGDGWSFGRGIAQAYDPIRDVTWRTDSPMERVYKVEELAKNKLRFFYKEPFSTKKEFVYQLRDAIRDEVAGFVNRSKDIKFEGVNYYYLGNFGIVCQYSDNLLFKDMKFMPEDGSGRTNAGFADFLQVSGCKGLLRVENCVFVGAHDDPINVHGTHLKVIDVVNDKQVKLRFMHPQTYGFPAFYANDRIEFVNSLTLNPILKAVVKEAILLNEREMLVTLTKAIDTEAITKLSDVAVENVTWTPDVEIVNNYFSRIPTRGILITTRGKVLIADNVFHRMQMSGILISNDAMSWYESGPVRDVTIRNNTFYECGYPVINISPENKENNKAVHQNIRIVDNKFILLPQAQGAKAIHAKSVNGLLVRDNTIDLNGIEAKSVDSFFQFEHVDNATIKNNSLGTIPWTKK